jgi:hypothetical protein
VSTMSAADAWQQTGRPASRRTAPPAQPGDRRRAPDRAAAEGWPAHDDSAEFSRPSAAGRPGDVGRGRPQRASDARYPDPRRADARDSRVRPQERSAPAQTGGGRLRGAVAVLLVVLVTLAGAAADSVIGIGLGTLTLVALVGSTVVATLLVRRRDLVSVLVAPPLVFVAVAVADLSIAPSAHFSLTALAPLLIKGFPAMGIATVLGLVLAVVRRAAGR